MAMIKVDKDLCKGCRLCIATCPQQILEMSTDLNSIGDRYCTQTDASKCTGCAFCALICPDSAIEVYR